MRKTAWIWFAGFAAWLIDGLVSIHYRDWLHARLALTVAMLFFVAGLFYRRQPR
jgi:NADH:ubiquinone oxidoreductase subunit 6 (subunit J)